MRAKDRLSRREFLKYAAMAVGGLALSAGESKSAFANFTHAPQNAPLEPPFPENTALGRVCVGGPGTPVTIRSEPYLNAPAVRRAWFDEVFIWKKQVV